MVELTYSHDLVDDPLRRRLATYVPHIPWETRHTRLPVHTSSGRVACVESCYLSRVRGASREDE